MTKSILAIAAVTAQLLLASSGIAAQPVTGPDDPAGIVQPVYDALTATTPSGVRTSLESATTPDWKNCALNDVCETREATIARWSTRITSVPDLRFEIKDVLVSGNRIIVRSEVSGTPSGPFMGVDPQGRSFQLMTIDIHEIDSGKIARTFHVEDWARALRQLREDPA